MCVIVVKPNGVDMPSKEVLRNCFVRNSDGSGYMFIEDDQVHIKKGYMTFPEFYENVIADYERMGGKKACFVMHFRIGTMGSNSKELTHPYPVSKNLDELKLTETFTRIGMAHNGIISLTSNRGDNKVDRNDTMAYITDYISLFMKTEEDFKDEDKMKVLKNLLGSGNKLAFLMKDSLYMVGEFTADKDTGCYFSNMYWKPYQYSNYYNRYNDWDDYEYGCYYDGYGSYYKNNSFNNSLGKTYSVGNKTTEQPKKEEGTNTTNTTDTIEGQREIEELLREEEDKEFEEYCRQMDLEEYYDDCLDLESGLYKFTPCDCPFEWEQRIDFCDKTVCAYAKRCPYYKSNLKEKKRKIKLARKKKKLENRRKKEIANNIIPFVKKGENK